MEKIEVYELEAAKPNRLNIELLENDFTEIFTVNGLAIEQIKCKDDSDRKRLRIDIVNKAGYEYYLTEWDIRNTAAIKFSIGQKLRISKKNSNKKKLFVESV